MAEAASTVLAPWANFYIMAGTAAATLTGLMFVVITLVSRFDSNSHDGIATFSTPTVLHFCTALLVCAMLVAPWHSPIPAAIVVGVTGLYGVIHVLNAMSRARRLKTYHPDLEDWISYTILPIVAYGLIAAGAIALARLSTYATLALACGVILLIFVGIRNAWDIVTYIVVSGGDLSEEAQPKDGSPTPD